MRFSNKFKDKLKEVGLGDLITQIWYRLDWRKPNMESVNKFLEKELIWLRSNQYKYAIPKFNGNNDQIINEIVQWVKDNITYKPDIERFKVVEKWQTCMETLIYRTGDCEDGAILIYCLAILHGISPVQVNITTRWIVHINGTKEGHCCVKYVSDHDLTPPFKYQIKDWCFSGEYSTEWWSVTHL